MITKKAGGVLLDLESKKIALVFRRAKDGYSFPKGHVEEGETLEQCAVREIKEETGRKNHILEEPKLPIMKYITRLGENVELQLFIAIDEGKTDKEIPEDLQEEVIWVSMDEVEEKLSYNNFKDLKEFWDSSRKEVEKILKKI